MSTQTVAPPKKRKRGTENVRDMLLSLGACMLVVVPVWYLAQPPESDSKSYRVVDPGPELASFRALAPGVPVPTGLPAGWRATSSTLDGSRLRIGYLTPGGGYAEYAAQGGAPEAFVADQTGDGKEVSPLTVGTRRFVVWSDDQQHTSLVLAQPQGTVVVGGLREDADDAEVQALAASLR